MSTLIHYELECTVSQYDYIWSKLRELEIPNEISCRSHIGAIMPDGNMIVTDVFDSTKDFEAFGKILLPIIEASGAKAMPRAYPIHFAFSREFSFQREADKTALLVAFKTQCTPEQYAAIWDDLEKMELPAGGVSHLGALGNDGNMVVFDLIESAEVLTEFQSNVAPIIAKHGAKIDVSVFPVVYGFAEAFTINKLPARV
jgi:hypothetical protein